jgi:hypothetical protein
MLCVVCGLPGHEAGGGRFPKGSRRQGSQYGHVAGALQCFHCIAALFVAIPSTKHDADMLNKAAEYSGSFAHHATHTTACAFYLFQVISGAPEQGAIDEAPL